MFKQERTVLDFFSLGILTVIHVVLGGLRSLVGHVGLGLVGHVGLDLGLVFGDVRRIILAAGSSYGGSQGEEGLDGLLGEGWRDLVSHVGLGSFVAHVRVYVLGGSLSRRPHFGPGLGPVVWPRLSPGVRPDLKPDLRVGWLGVLPALELLLLRLVLLLVLLLLVLRLEVCHLLRLVSGPGSLASAQKLLEFVEDGVPLVDADADQDHQAAEDGAEDDRGQPVLGVLEQLKKICNILISYF